MLFIPMQLMAKNYQLDTAHLHPPFSICVMPCQLISGTYADGVTLGTEFRVYHPLSLSLEAGPFFESGYMAKTNLKFYIPVSIEDNMEQAPYIALEYAYKEQSYKVTDRLKGPPKSEVKYTVSKHANTVHLKLGAVMSRKGSVFMDMYVGLGIRYRVVDNSLLPDQEKTLYHRNEGFTARNTHDKCEGYALSIALGWKVGWRYR